jgi:hypothetical protein
MMVRMAGTILAVAVSAPWTGCLERFNPNADDEASVRVTLVNGSSTQYVSPNLGVCPMGMATPPHYFVTPAPVLAPGQQITYSTDQIAGASGNCQTFATDFTIGLCGYSYGASAEGLTAIEGPYRGIIGTHFNCGDTVVLTWSDAGSAQGSWTSEVQPAAGNPTPTEAFGPP